LPFTVRVVVMTVTPEAVVVATECVTRGPVPGCALAPAAAPVTGAADVAAGAAAGVGDAWWARATAAVLVPAMSAAAVRLDIRRTCRRPSRRAPPPIDGFMLVSFRASAYDPRLRER
jgi:hypothetical protein